MQRLRNVFFLFLFISFSTCRTDDLNPPVDDIDSCHFELNLDSLQIANNIIGTWQWVYEFGTGTLKTFESSSSQLGVSIQIKSDGSLIVFRDGELDSEMTWHLENHTGGGVSDWYLVCDPFNSLASGYVRICDMYLALKNSYTDGSDHYFKRVNFDGD